MSYSSLVTLRILKLFCLYQMIFSSIMQLQYMPKYICFDGSPPCGWWSIVITLSVCRSALYWAHDNLPVSFLEKVFMNFIHESWIRQRKTSFRYSDFGTWIIFIGNMIIALSMTNNNMILLQKIFIELKGNGQIGRVRSLSIFRFISFLATELWELIFLNISQMTVFSMACTCTYLQVQKGGNLKNRCTSHLTIYTQLSVKAPV